MLRNTHGISFTARKIKNEGGLHYVALRTVRHFINKNDDYFRQLRRKSQVIAKGRKKRINYAKEELISTSDFWFKDVSFYLDVVSFVHKLDTMDEMRFNGEQTIPKKGQRTAHNCEREERRYEQKNCSFVCSYCLRQRCSQQFLGKYSGDSYSNFVLSTSQPLLLKPVTAKANYFYKMGTLYKTAKYVAE